MQGNVLGQGGFVSTKGSSILNIYQKLNAPLEKDGVWIKSDEQINDISITNKFPYNYQEISLAITNVFKCISSTVGNNIFIFGGGNGSDVDMYDTISGTKVSKRNVPAPIEGMGDVISINETYIYIFGTSYNSSKRVYKYEISSNTYTQLTNMIYQFSKGSAVKVNGEIYLLGFDDNNDIYKYDMENDTYTKIVTIPYTFSGTSNANDTFKAVAVGTNIYLFGRL